MDRSYLERYTLAPGPREFDDVDGGVSTGNARVRDDYVFIVVATHRRLSCQVATPTEINPSKLLDQLISTVAEGI